MRTAVRNAVRALAKGISFPCSSGIWHELCDLPGCSCSCHRR